MTMRKLKLNMPVDEIKTAKEIETITQNHSQYDNGFVALYKAEKAVIVWEYTGVDTYEYLLSGNDKKEALSNSFEFLQNWIGENISNSADDSFDIDLQRLQWRLDTAEKLKADPGSKHDTYRILEEGSYIGYTPFSWLENEMGYEVLEFSSYAEAEKYLKEWDSGTYLLGNNECGRPDYFIMGN